MARIAFIKLFNSMYLGPAQLMGELERAGHEGINISFKQFKSVHEDEIQDYKQTPYSSTGYIFEKNLERVYWDAYNPVKEVEIKTLVQELKLFKPDAIAFSLLSCAIDECANVNQRLREYFDVPFIWGGPGPTLEPEECIDYADILCRNEGEEVIVEFANRIDAGEDLCTIAGTWGKRTDGEVVVNPERPLLDLETIAIPEWDISKFTFVNLNKAHKNIYPKVLEDTYFIMTQRGCPFSCSFCIESRYQEMYGKKSSLRRRSVDIVIEELVHAKNTLPIRGVNFYDDVFTLNPRWLKEFLPRYKKEVGLPFWCYTYPNVHNIEIMDLLVDAGLISITMGLQHGSERVLREFFNRPTDMDQTIESIKEITDRGNITCFIDILTKIPMEEEKDLRETFEFLLKIPKAARLNGFTQTLTYPTYSYTKKIKDFKQTIPLKNASEAEKDEVLGIGLCDDDYRYYHKLHLLTRTDMPIEKIRAIGSDPKYRENHDLLNELIINGGYSFVKQTAPLIETQKLGMDAEI